MPAPVWTWVDVVGPASAPYLSGPYRARVDLDLSAYIGYFTGAGSSTITMANGSQFKMALANTPGWNGRLEDITNSGGTSQFIPIIKAISSAIDTLDTSGTYWNQYYVPTISLVNYQIKFDGIRLTTAAPQRYCQTFAIEVPAGIRANLVTWFGELAKTPTHLVIENTTGTPNANWAWFDTSVYDSSLHVVTTKSRPCPYPNPIAQEIDDTGNIGISTNPLNILGSTSSNGDYAYLCPVIAGSSVYFADNAANGVVQRRGLFALLGMGKTIRLIGGDPIGVAAGYDPYLFETPYTVVTYYDAMGTVLGDETLYGTWEPISNPYAPANDFYRGKDTTFALTPPAGAIMYSALGDAYYGPQFGYASPLSLYGYGFGEMLYVPISPYAISVLDGAGPFLPGVLLKPTS